jgi:ADP-L-glycero-D-manno-heptose 6-epimerase
VIIVTGGAGFVGSHVVQALNARGRTDIVVVDELEDGHKLLNLVGLEIEDLIDRRDFLARIAAEREFPGPVTAVLHQGACADTTAWNGNHVLERNYDDSRALLRYCSERAIPFIYASSAAVYGSGSGFRVQPADEAPQNLYALSKLLFDQWVRRLGSKATAQIVGLRYFNVYGPREGHKGEQASVPYKHWNQMRARTSVDLFEGSGGYGNGEQQRDFVWVEDCARVNLWFLDHPEHSGIYNVGTGQARSFNDLASAVLRHFGRGEIRYVPFPAGLREHYQSYTRADIAPLRGIGYDAPFVPIEEGVPRYMEWLDRRRSLD